MIKKQLTHSGNNRLSNEFIEASLRAISHERLVLALQHPEFEADKHGEQ